MSKKLIYVLLPIIALTLIIAMMILKLIDQQLELSPWIGKEVPAFSISSTNGTELSQETLKGRAHMVTFFASWCSSCRVEHKALSAIVKQTNIPYIGIASRDAEEAVSSWLKKFGNPFSLLAFDTLGAVGMEWGVSGIPQTFVVDDKGIIVYHTRGAVVSDAEISNITKAIQKVQ